MDINLTISAAPSITDKIAIRVYSAAAPSVVVDMQEFSAPHSAARNITFASLDPGVYIVNTYSTPGDPVVGTLRHSFIYDPTFQSADIKATEFLKMTAGNNQYTDNAWAGYDIDIVYRTGFGPLFPTDQISWVLNGSSQVIGFQLSQIGDVFAADEQFTVSFKPKITTVSPVVTSAKIVTSEEVITADEVLTSSQIGRLLRLQGVNPSFTVSLPAIGSIQAYSLFMLVSDGGSHTMVTIDIDGAGSINHFGNRTQLHLAQGEKAWILYTGTDYVVLNDCPGPLRVGEIIDIYDKDITVQGAIFADGSLLDRDEYPRLWDFVNQLDGSMLITDAAWTASTAQHGRFSLGDGTTTFRLPRLYTDGYARGVDGSSRLAGSHQDDAVLTHEHESPIGTLPTTLFGRGLLNRLIGNYGATSTNKTDLTGPPVDANGADNVKGTENLTNNFGVYKLIRI